VSSGDVVANQSRSAYYPLTCKLSPAARMELRLPTIVYLAWPAVFLLDGTWVHTDDGGVAAATWLRDATGIVAVSPFMNPEWPSTSLEIAGLFAERCDAVVVMDDPLLVGREDVASASRANIGISVVRMVDRAGVHGERDLWLPPLAIPSGK
jgi:heme A synthase